jgi:hypothetical protein
MRRDTIGTNAHSLGLLAAALVLGVALTASSAGRAQSGPGFPGGPLYMSDIDYSVKTSPDGKTVSLGFKKFRLVLLKGEAGSPTVSRTAPWTIPVKEGGKGAKVRIEARGQSDCPDGSKCLVILWLNGQTSVMPVSQGTAPMELLATADFSLPAVEVVQATVILLAERETKRSDAAPMMRIGSLDLTINPSTVVTEPNK